MQHVDEGTIHAWLDDQISDPAEAARIEAHLRDCAGCRALLIEERATFDRARTLLAGTAPAVEQPSFDALAARAGHDMPAAVAAAADLTRRRRERFVQWSWAASLALAVGLGWTARELTDDDATTPAPAAATVERPSPAAGAGVGNTTPSIPAPAPAPPARAAAPSAPPREPRQIANADAQRSEPRRQAAPATPAEESGAPAPLTETIALAAPPTVPDAATAPVAAAPPPAAAANVSTPPSVATSRLEAVTVADGQWRAVPRTEAAARTGMPLYGIDGLEPQYTGLSADGALVRTLYRLESGQLVELVQQRNVPATPAAADAQAMRRALVAGRADTFAPRQSTAPPPLTIVRGDLRLTLQTSSGAADLAALGLRLRVD